MIRASDTQIITMIVLLVLVVSLNVGAVRSEWKQLRKLLKEWFGWRSHSR